VPYKYKKCNKENIISQFVKVQAQVTVTPLVAYGKPKVCCINSSITPNPCECCDYNSYENDCNCNSMDCNFYDWNTNYDETCESGKSETKCNFTLTQVICIEIPISIDADVNVKEGIACCGKHDVKPIDNINKKKPFSYMPMI